MIKTMTTGEVQMLGNTLMRLWEEKKMDIHMAPVSLYHLIGLKKTIQEHMNKIAETVSTIIEQHDGQRQEDGSLKVPPEKVDEVNLILGDLAKETIDLEYEEITIGKNDALPVELMDALFDFIAITE